MKEYNVLTNSNKKIKYSGKVNGVRLYEFNLPAVKTCHWADVCKKYCFADKGSYKWRTTVEKYARNYELSKNQVLFKKVVQYELDKKRVEYVRIHSSGDFYNTKYLKAWADIARNNPDIIFYGYTKSIPLFKHLTAPENFVFCFSVGGKKDHLIKSTDHHAKIFNNKKELLKAGYKDCSKDDLMMLTTKKVGLIYH